jgi:hypothetical protein
VDAIRDATIAHLSGQTVTVGLRPVCTARRVVQVPFSARMNGS